MSYLLEVGAKFTFKGIRCQVTEVHKKGFRYTNLVTGSLNCYMDWDFYKTTNSYIGNQPAKLNVVWKKEVVSNRRLKQLRNNPDNL